MLIWPQGTINQDIASEALSLEADNMTRRRKLVAGVAVFVAVWAVYWLIWGHRLTYDVLAGGRYLYSEDFSLSGRLIITTLVAGVLTGGILGTWALVGLAIGCLGKLRGNREAAKESGRPTKRVI